MSGDPLTFSKGDFDDAKAPPLLLVHGTDDGLVTYEASVDGFNRAQAPKGVLTIKHGDHQSPTDPSGVTGPVATGVCDSDHPDCQIVFNDGGSLEPSASVRISISFAPSSASGTT